MRDKKIIKVSIIGIITNIILVIFKAIVGFLANSISIILDAVNNLTDVLSSVITIIGTKISTKKPDKEHPYGHGRAEYFASIIIAVIVLITGLVALKESFDKIISNATATYDLITFIIVFIAIFVKLFLGNYYKKEGKKLNSSSLTASGIDAIGDSFISLSTLIGALISYIWHINLEGYIGIVISLLITKTAIGILKETVDEMIGVRADSSLTKKLRKLINTYDGVLGVYDLTLHNYGPNNIIGTAHIEVKDDMKAKEIHKLTRNMTIDVYNVLGIIMTFGIYSSNESKYNDLKTYLMQIIKGYKTILQLHAFYVEEEKNIVSFDLVFDFDEKDPEQIKHDIINKMKEKYPKYNYLVILDKDYSD